MPETEEKRIELAAGAGKEEMRKYVHDPSPLVIRSLLGNMNLTEEEILIIANRRNLPADILEMIAKNRRWSESYPIRLALARNPGVPLSVSLSIARFLRVFDLEEITRSVFIPLVFRHKAEALLIERIPTMPLGNKKSLAKKAAGNVLRKLLQDRIPEVVHLCLDNPHMIEAHLYKAISRADTPRETILMVAEHPVWSSRSLVRFSLVRNSHTPLSISVHFLRSMKLVDVRELYTDPSLPVTIKPLVYRELRERGIDPEKIGEDRIYEIKEEEIEDTDQAALTDEADQPAEDAEGENRIESRTGN